MSIALPTVEKEWRLEPAQLQWVMSAYPLSSVSLAQHDYFQPRVPDRLIYYLRRILTLCDYSERHPCTYLVNDIGM
jgi:hypothetical protein